jgi:Transposase DDE domain group 1
MLKGEKPQSSVEPMRCLSIYLAAATSWSHTSCADSARGLCEQYSRYKPFAGSLWRHPANDQTIITVFNTSYTRACVVSSKTRLLRAIRSNWPKTEILLRADSHYCTPETIDFCRANGLDFIFGVAPTSTLRAHILPLEAKATAMFAAAPKNGKGRRFKEFFDGAQSWSRVERIVARVEAGADGPDTRFVVTNLTTRNARKLYEDVYCRRGQAENYIKSWKTHLAADRTSCMKASYPASRHLSGGA